MADAGAFRASWAWSWSWRASSSGATGSKSGGKRGRPLPPADSPNVLLIVLDTVRADRLSLYGYQRATSRRSSSWRGGASASTRRGRQRPGPSPRTRACSPAAGPTSSTSNGGPRSAADFPTLAEYLGSHGLRDRGFRRQYRVLLVRHGARPRLHPLRRLPPSIFSTCVPCGRRRWSHRLGRDCHPGSVAEPEPSPGRFHSWLKWLVARRSQGCRIDQSRISRTGCPTGKSRGVPSSPSSITSTPMRPTCRRRGGVPLRRGPRTPGRFHPPDRTLEDDRQADCWPRTYRATDSRLLRQLSCLSGRAAGRVVRYIASGAACSIEPW